MFPFWPYLQTIPDCWAAFISFSLLVILEQDFEADLYNYEALSQMMKWSWRLQKNLFISLVINLLIP